MLAKTFVTFTASLLVGLAIAGPAFATPITGSDTIGATVTSSNSANLGTATQFGLGSASQRFSLASVGTGSFSVIPVGTTVPLSTALLNLGNLASFAFTSPTVGTFTPGTISESNQTATTLDLTLTGTFAPGTLFGAGATAPSGASEIFNFVQTSQGITVTGTFAAPPVTVPEPLPISLIGLGLVGLLALGSRRKTV